MTLLCPCLTRIDSLHLGHLPRGCGSVRFSLEHLDDHKDFNPGFGGHCNPEGNSRWSSVA